MPDVPHHHIKTATDFPPQVQFCHTPLILSILPPVLWTCYLVISDCCGEGILESLCCPQGRKLQWSTIKFGSYSACLDQAHLTQSQPVAITSGQIIANIQNVNFKLILCLTVSPFQYLDKGRSPAVFLGRGKKILNTHIT